MTDDPLYREARNNLCALVWSDDHELACDWWYGERDKPCTCGVGQAVDEALAPMVAKMVANPPESAPTTHE